MENKVNFAINTYGHIDAMFYTMQGVAMVFSNELYRGILMSLFAIWVPIAVLQMVQNGTMVAFRTLIGKIIIVLIIFNTFFAPSPSNLIIRDLVTKQTKTVANVPLGFSVPILLIETVGLFFTSIVEQAFAVTGSFNFSNFGMVFGASLVQEFNNMKITNPELIYNFENFCDRCLIPAVMIGDKITLQELQNSGDVWKDLRAIYPSGKIGMRQALVWDEGRRSLKPCSVVMDILDKQFNNDVTRLIGKYSNSIFNKAGGDDQGNNVASGFFKKNLENIFSTNFGINVKAQDALRQIMIMHSFSNFGGYGDVRTIWQQENAWKTAGEISNYYLPMLLTTLKCLAYLALIFVLPMMIVTSNFNLYPKYLVSLISFQLWPALYSVLNMIIELYSGARMHDLADGAVSFTTFSQIGMLSDKIAAVVGGMQLLVPYLSYLITQGSLDGLVHLAQGVTGIFQNTASGVASEVTSGNRSFDNVSANNMSFDNNSSFKTDLNSSYSAGGTKTQGWDGSYMSATPDGHNFSTSGAGLNKMSAGYKFDLNNSMQNQMSKAYNEQMSHTQGLQASSANAESRTMQNAINVFDDLAKNESLVTSFAKEQGSSEEKALSNMASQYKSLVHDQGKSKEEAAGAVLSGSFGFSFGSFSASFSGSSSTSGSTRNSLSENSGVQNNDSINNNLGVMERALSNEAFTKGANLNEGVGRSFNESYHQSQEFRSQAHAAQDRLQSLAVANQQIQNAGANSSRDVTDEVTHQVASNMNMGYDDARKALESGDRTAWHHANETVNHMADEVLAKEYHIPTMQNFEAQTTAKYDTQKATFQNAISNDIEAGTVANIAQDKGYSSLPDSVNDGGKFLKDFSAEKMNTINEVSSENTDKIKAQQTAFQERKKELDLNPVSTFLLDDAAFDPNKETVKEEKGGNQRDDYPFIP